jgi:hypothetical protein
MMKAIVCENCKHCREIEALGGWRFFGCFYRPYRGKWIEEIKECPMSKGDE